MTKESRNELEIGLENEIKSVEYFIERSPKTGDYTLSLKKEGKKQYILSKYKPKEHAIEQLGKDLGNKKTIWILIGYGFGYMTEAILSKVGMNTRIIIIEPNQKLFEEQLELCPIREEAIVYSITKINPVIMKEQLLSVISPEEMNNIAVRFLNNYTKIYEKFCKQVEEIITDIKTDLEINYNTILKYQDKNYLNSLQNARFIKESYDITHLKDICKGVPILIVCAGPSLNKNIDEIKNFKGIIFAMGRTITPLFEHGIRPDFIVSLDPTDMIVETFGKYKEHNVPLITSIDASNKVVMNSHAERYFLYNNPVIVDIFKTRVNEPTSWFDSVSTLCLSLAEFLECNPIIIVGQDLAFTGNKMHAEDTQLIEESPTHIITKGFDGKPVISEHIYIAIKRWFESQILLYPKITHINATEGGVYIEGMLHMTLKEAIEKYCTKDKPKITHIKLENLKEVNYEKCIKEAKSSLSKIQRLTKLIVTYYKKLEEEYEKDDQRNWQKINDLYKHIDKLKKSIERIPNSKNLMDLLSHKVKMILEANNIYKEQLNEVEWEEDIRVTHYLVDKYNLLSQESEQFIQLINIAMEDEIKENS